MSSNQSVKSPNSPPPAPPGSSAQQVGSSSSGSKSSSGQVGLQRASSVTSNTSSSPATSPGLIFSHKHALLKRAISDMLRSDSENSEEPSKQEESTKYVNSAEPPEKQRTLSRHQDSEGQPNVESSITEINLASPKSDLSQSAHSKSVIKNAENIKKEKIKPEEPQGFISLISPKEGEESKEDVKPVVSEANNRELQMLQDLPETVRHKVMKSMSESGCKFDEMRVDTKPSDSVEEKYGRGDMQSSLLTALYEELMKTRQEVEKLRKVQELMLTEKEDKKDDSKEVMKEEKDSSTPEKKVEKRKYLELTKDGDASEESKPVLEPEVKVAKIGIRSDLSEDSAKKSQTPVSTSRNFASFTSPPPTVISSSPSEVVIHSSHARISSLVSNPTVTQAVPVPIPSSVITTFAQSGISLSSTSPNLCKISSQIEITSLPAPSTSPIVLQSSSLPRTSPVLPQTSPVLPRASPGLSRTSPPGSRTSPAIARISPSLPRISPSLSRTSPSLPRTSPSLPRASPSLPRTSPGLARTSPAASSVKERLPADLGANKLRALFGTNSEVEVMPITPGEKGGSYEPQQSGFLRLLDEPQQQQEPSLLLSAVRGHRREVEITASRDGTVFRQPHEDRRLHQPQHEVERKKTHYSTSDLPEFPPTTHKPPPPLKPVPSVLRRHSETHDPRDPMLHRLMYQNNHSSPATPTTSSLPIDHHTAASLYYAQPKSSPTQHPPLIQSGRRSSESSSDMAREHQHAIAMNMQQHIYRQQHLRPSPPLSLGPDKATIFPIPPPAPAVRPYRSPPPPPSTRSLEQYQSSMMDPASTEDLYRSNLQFFERIKQNIHQTCDANLSLQERGGFVGSERGIATHDRMQSPAGSVDKPPQPQTFVPRVLVRNSIPESSPRLPHIPPPYPGPSYVGHNPHLTGPLQPNHPGQYPNNMHHSSGTAIHQMAPAGLIPGMHQPSVIMTSPDNAVRSKNSGAGTVDKKQCLNNCPQQARFLCSGCKKAWYCSEKCQREHWAMHSQSCSP